MTRMGGPMRLRRFVCWGWRPQLVKACSTEKPMPGRESRRVPSRSKKTASGGVMSVLRGIAGEHVCGELFGGEEGVHVFEVGCLDLAVGQDAGAEARLELLGDVEEDVEDSGTGLVEFLLDEGEVVHAGDREGWDAVGGSDLDHVGEGDAAGGS